MLDKCKRGNKSAPLWNECQRGVILLPLKHLSSNCIISTLFYCLTIEQFLMQPDPGCTTKCIKNCTFSGLGCIINCTLSDFGCIKKCTPSRNCALQNATYFEKWNLLFLNLIFLCFLRWINNYNQIPHSQVNQILDNVLWIFFLAILNEAFDCF